MFTPRFAWLCRAACLLFLSVAISYADTLTGRVTDPQGNRVPNAQLRLFERKSGALRTGSSSASGEYAFRELPPGDYLIEAEASSAVLTGFKDISVNGDVNADIDLAITAKAFEISVTASSTPVSVEEVAK